MAKQNKQYVMVTTTTRSIYAGYLVEEDKITKRVVLHGLRHCYSYVVRGTAGQFGVFSLATVGPCEGSRIGPIVTTDAVVYDVALIVPCTAAAQKAWEGSTWTI